MSLSPPVFDGLHVAVVTLTCATIERQISRIVGGAFECCLRTRPSIRTGLLPHAFHSAESNLRNSARKLWSQLQSRLYANSDMRERARASAGRTRNSF